MRIEDTDLDRSNQASVDVILEGMSWLGMDPDEGPFYQMKRMDRYREVLAKLVELEAVYPCYMSVEELDALREKFIPVMRSAGMSLSPFNAWVVLKGLETLGIRMKAQCAQALEFATWLETHPKVSKVYYPGLINHPQHALAMDQQSGMGGAVLSFDVKASSPADARQKAFTVIDKTQLMSVTANLGDVKTIITHPPSTSHGRLTEEQRHLAGIEQNLIRIAVGLEHLDDLKRDLSLGLDAV